MAALSPWSLARRVAGRRGVLLFVIAAMLYGFGLHAALACQPAVKTGVAVSDVVAAVHGSPCHHDEADVAQAACEAHCRTDTQSSRLSLSFDLPEAALTGFAPVPLPVPLAGPSAPDASPLRRDTGPPLHILLHRLLR